MQSTSNPLQILSRQSQLFCWHARLTADHVKQWLQCCIFSETGVQSLRTQAVLLEDMIALNRHCKQYVILFLDCTADAMVLLTDEIEPQYEPVPLQGWEAYNRYQFHIHGSTHLPHQLFCMQAPMAKQVSVL
jgi:hypothetical protein